MNKMEFANIGFSEQIRIALDMYSKNELPPFNFWRNLILEEQQSLLYSWKHGIGKQ